MDATPSPPESLDMRPDSTIEEGELGTDGGTPSNKASSRAATEIRASIAASRGFVASATTTKALCSWFLLATCVYAWNVIQDESILPSPRGLVVPPYGWRRLNMGPWYGFGAMLATLSLASALELVNEDTLTMSENYVTMCLKTVGLAMLTGELLDAMCLRGFPESVASYPAVWAAIGGAPVAMYSYDAERHEDRSTSIANLIILVCSFIQVFLAVNSARYWLLVCPIIFSVTYAEALTKRFDGDTYLYLAVMSLIYAHVVDDMPMVFTQIAPAIVPSACCEPPPPHCPVPPQCRPPPTC